MLAHWFGLLLSAAKSVVTPVVTGGSAKRRYIIDGKEYRVTPQRAVAIANSLRVIQEPEAKKAAPVVVVEPEDAKESPQPASRAITPPSARPDMSGQLRKENAKRLDERAKSAEIERLIGHALRSIDDEECLILLLA